MTNVTSAQILNEWDTTDTNKLVPKTWQSDCEGIEFAIRANTDVGPSNSSQPIITGFPNGKIRSALLKVLVTRLLLFISDDSVAHYEGKTNVTFATQELGNGSILLAIYISVRNYCNSKALYLD